MKTGRGEFTQAGKHAPIVTSHILRRQPPDLPLKAQQIGCRSYSGGTTYDNREDHALTLSGCAILHANERVQSRYRMKESLAHCLVFFRLDREPLLFFLPLLIAEHILSSVQCDYILFKITITFIWLCLGHNF
jgi:hypothetical protein